MTTTLKEKAQLVVPLSVQRRARIKAGDRLQFKAAPGIITITTRPAVADDEYTPEQRRAIDRGIAQSEREYKQGHYFGPFATHEEFIASLHKEAGKLRAKKNKRIGQ